MQSGISDKFNCCIEGIIHRRNSENHNLCEEVIGHYEYRYESIDGIHQAALKQLIEDLQLSLQSYEAAGIK
jgi:hypothetical protein